MENSELIKWMKDHGVDEQLRLWIQNGITGIQDYSLLEGLITKGEVQLRITIDNENQLHLETVQQTQSQTAPPQPILPPIFEQPVIEAMPTMKATTRRRVDKVENP